MQTIDETILIDFDVGESILFSKYCLTKELIEWYFTFIFIPANCSFCFLRNRLENCIRHWCVHSEALTFTILRLGAILRVCGHKLNAVWPYIQIMSISEFLLSHLFCATCMACRVVLDGARADVYNVCHFCSRLAYLRIDMGAHNQFEYVCLPLQYTFIIIVNLFGCVPMSGTI